jgi:hypothetical protein
MVAVVDLRDGSRAMGGLSVRGLMNIVVRDSSDDFTFIVGDYHYQCLSFVAQFLSPRVSKLQWIEAMISELRLEVEDQKELFCSVLEATGSGAKGVETTPFEIRLPCERCFRFLIVILNLVSRVGQIPSV